MMDDSMIPTIDALQQMVEGAAKELYENDNFQRNMHWQDASEEARGAWLAKAGAALLGAGVAGRAELTVAVLRCDGLNAELNEPESPTADRIEHVAQALYEYDQQNYDDAPSWGKCARVITHAYQCRAAAALVAADEMLVPQDPSGVHVEQDDGVVIVSNLPDACNVVIQIKQEQ